MVTDIAALTCVLHALPIGTPAITITHTRHAAVIPIGIHT